jgi:uncharacterized delta-60 repeat protein
MRRRVACGLAAAASGMLTLGGLGAGAAQAQLPAGFPDTSFGSGGQVQAPFGTGARAATLALGPDGAITVAGDLRGSGGEAALVARFTANGALDTTFSGTGSRLDRFGAGLGPGARQRVGGVAVAPDGSTVVAGVAGYQIMVARYLPNGELDGLFGAGGVVLRDLSAGGGMPDGTGLAAVALAPDGQIVVAGSVGVAPDDPYGENDPGEQVVVGRLSARGVPDPSFGLGGFSLIQLGARSARRPARSKVTALGLGPGGTIVVAGRSSGTNGADRAIVVRLTAAGLLDSRFGRAGRLVLQLGRGSAARPASSALHALALRPDGRVVVAGRGTDVAGGGQAVLARLTVGGALDATFGRAGIVRTQAGAPIKQRAPESSARAIAFTPDGRTLVTGSNSLGAGFTLRLAPSGELDCGYGSQGEGAAFGATLPLRPADPSLDGAFGVLAQPDGAYVAAGRLPGGGLLLGRITGGPGGAGAPNLHPLLRTVGARYLGGGRAVVYGAVLANCSAADVRFVASPGTGGGRPISSRPSPVPGRFGTQLVCGYVRGLKPGRTYRVRIASTRPRGPAGATRVLRAVKTSRAKPHPQEGCA